MTPKNKSARSKADAQLGITGISLNYFDSLRLLRLAVSICIMSVSRYSIFATVASHSSSISGLFIAFAVLGLASLTCRNTSQSRSDRASITPAQRAELQADKDKACNTVERLRKAGAFTKIESGYSGVTHAYVDRDFHAIPVDAKETALKAVALCHISLDKQQQIGLVVIHDGYSGKRIGTFDFASGLNLD